MSRTIIDIHILQTVPPSNVNRDDTGSPKTAVFGGVRRARVSSQAWKRATRVAFDDLLEKEDLGIRTKRLVEIVAARIAAINPDLAEEATDFAERIVKSTGIELERASRKKGGGKTEENLESKYLVFLSNLQVDLLAHKAVELAADPDSGAAFKAFKGKGLVDRAHSVDLSLFGRMVADVTDLNVDACAQVAHAISVHGVDNEFDYFTAVDDEKQRAADEDAGAGMIGTVEFNSSTLYRYATVDVDGLVKNLGDAVATRRAVEAFLQAFITSMPTGKQNTFANRTLPDAVVVMVRDAQPVNLVGAFEEAVSARAGRARLAIAAEKLVERAIEVSEVYGAVPVATWVLGLGAAREGLEKGLAANEGLEVTWTSLPSLPEAVGQMVSERAEAPR